MASDHEGFCVPLAEAMGHGVPIVAYGVTAVPETVGGAGLVLDDKSAVPFAAAVGTCAARPDAARGPGDGRAGAGGGVRPGGVDPPIRHAGATGRRRSGVSGERRDEVDGTVPRRREIEGVDAACRRRGQASRAVPPRCAGGPPPRPPRRGRGRPPTGRRRPPPRAGRPPRWPRPARRGSSPRGRAPRTPRGARSARRRPTRPRRQPARRRSSAPLNSTASCRPMSSTKRCNAAV